MQAQRTQETTIPQVSWRTIEIGAEFNALFYSFKQSAYRLETLQSYAEPSESSPFNQYRRGVIPDPSFMSEWCELVKGHSDAGHSMRRVHIVDLPLSQYMRFEIECCYRDTGAAGEDIRLLDRAKLSPELLKITQEDFWFLDGSTVIINDYDKNGALYQARITSDPKAVEYYLNVQKKTWDISVPFETFYTAHAELKL